MNCKGQDRGRPMNTWSKTVEKIVVIIFDLTVTLMSYFCCINELVALFHFIFQVYSDTGNLRKASQIFVCVS